MKSAEKDAVEKDIRFCTDYESDIYKFHREVEDKWRPVPDFLDSVQGLVDQKKRIKSQDRDKLIDWMFYFQGTQKAKNDTKSSSVDTIFFSVSLLDRYLSIVPLKLDDFAILASGCLRVAMKFEHVSTIEVKKFGNAHRQVTVEKLLTMEENILKSLTFDLWSPTTYTFLWKFAHMSELYDSEFDKLCEYLALLSLLDYSCAQFLPSNVSASVVFLANFIIRPDARPWSKSLASGTGYTSVELKDCVVRLHFMHQQGRSSSKAAGKNIRSKYREAAALDSESNIPDAYFQDSDD